MITPIKCINNTSDTNKPCYEKIRSAFIRKCFSKPRLDGASKFISVTMNVLDVDIMMDCILGSERRNKLNEKLINAFEGYEYFNKCLRPFTQFLQTLIWSNLTASFNLNLRKNLHMYEYHLPYTTAIKLHHPFRLHYF